MLSGLIGKKLGMTQLADAHGRVRAVTVVQLGPCTVTQLKAQPTDGYDSVQVTWGKKKLSRVSAPERGHFKKANVAVGVKTAEFEKRGEGEIQGRRTGRRAGRVQGPRLCGRDPAPSLRGIPRLARHA
jgi:ribosomal protein L3